MNRTQKADATKVLQDKFGRARVAIVCKFSGFSVLKATALRKAMRESSIDFKVVKNTLAKRAIEGTQFAPLKEHFRGPVIMALSYDDVVAPAKILDKFVKDEDGKGLEIRAGLMDGNVLSVAEVKQLASLPSLDESRSMLLNVFLAPATKLVRVLNEVPTGLVRVLNARQEKLG